MSTSSITTPLEAYNKARQLIDEVHKKDPLYQKRKERESAQGAAMANVGIAVDGLDVGGGEMITNSKDGEEDEKGQDELSYADSMEQWCKILYEKGINEKGKKEIILSSIPSTNPLELIKLAARCQHLERFSTPRSSFPEGKAGYLHWRRSLYTIQAEKASNLLKQAGLSEEEAKAVYIWVSKTDLKPGKEGGEWGTQLLEDAAVLVFLQDQLVHFTSQHPGYTREKWVEILKKTWRKLSEDGKQAALELEMPDPLKSIIQEAISNPSSVSA